MKGLISKETLIKYGNNFKERIDKAWEKKPPQGFELDLEFPLWGNSPVRLLGGTSTSSRGDARISE